MSRSIPTDQGSQLVHHTTLCHTTCAIKCSTLDAELCITNSAVAIIKLCLYMITSFTTRTTKLRVSKLSIEQTNMLVPGVAPMADEKFDVG